MPEIWSPAPRRSPSAPTPPAPKSTPAPKPGAATQDRATAQPTQPTEEVAKLKVQLADAHRSLKAALEESRSSKIACESAVAESKAAVEESTVATNALTECVKEVVLWQNSYYEAKEEATQQGQQLAGLLAEVEQLRQEVALLRAAPVTRLKTEAIIPDDPVAAVALLPRRLKVKEGAGTLHHEVHLKSNSYDDLCDAIKSKMGSTVRTLEVYGANGILVPLASDADVVGLQSADCLMLNGTRDPQADPPPTKAALDPAPKDTSLVARKDTSLVARKDTSLVARKDTSLVARKDTSLVARTDTSLVARKDTSLVARTDSGDTATAHAVQEHGTQRLSEQAKGIAPSTTAVGASHQKEESTAIQPPKKKMKQPLPASFMSM